MIDNQMLFILILLSSGIIYFMIKFTKTGQFLYELFRPQERIEELKKEAKE